MRYKEIDRERVRAREEQTINVYNKICRRACLCEQLCVHVFPGRCVYVSRQVFISGKRASTVWELQK